MFVEGNYLSSSDSTGLPTKALWASACQQEISSQCMFEDCPYFNAAHPMHKGSMSSQDLSQAFS